MRETTMKIYGFDVLHFPKYLGLFLTCFMTPPARTDIFRPGEVENTVLEKLGA